MNIIVTMLTFNNVCANKTYNVHYSAVAPSSYICLCIPSYIVKLTSYTSNITDWDGECSNNQICFWNEEEVLIKYWYSPNN
jgi:hypothetical protein